MRSSNRKRPTKQCTCQAQSPSEKIVPWSGRVILRAVSKIHGHSDSSQNYRFELEAANGLDYPKGSERPIAIFAKVSCRDFIYMLLMPGNTHYNEVMTFIGKTQAPSVKMRRLEYVARDVFKAIPGLAIWRRLEKEDSE